MNMKKKIFNLIELILQIVCLILILISDCTVMKHLPLGAQTSYPYEQDTTFIKELLALEIYTVPFIVLWISNFLLCIISIISKNEYKDSKLHTTLPIINFIFTSWCMSTVVYNMEFRSLLFGLLFMIVVISFIKRADFVAKPKAIEVENKQTSANKLIELKTLLDQNIITQEEFEKKKKELLNL